MWGASIVGFDSSHYTYASGREGDAPAVGFSPLKGALSVYLPDGVGAHSELLSRLGEHTTGVGCLYITDLDRADMAVLEEIISRSYSTITADVSGNRAGESAAAPDA